MVAAIREADHRLDGNVILGAEILWNGRTPHVVRANIPWDVLASLKKPCALALRIAPFPGPFAADDPSARGITAAARSLLAEARAHHFDPPEFQLDFDCAQKKLSGYRLWLNALRPLLGPTRFTITTLPAWLGEPAFPGLIDGLDGYILQVHSVPTLRESGHAVLCDPSLARKWVAAAAALGRPFTISLPTYWCLAGYDPQGHLLGAAMDSIQPAWPPGTSVLDFNTPADDIASLVHEWQTRPPPDLRGLLWYRLPVSTDRRNWRWPTLSAVMAGRPPRRSLQALCTGGNPIDLSLLNSGESDDPFSCTITVTWHGASLVASDSLPGWDLRRIDPAAVQFSRHGTAFFRLPPGAEMSIGWLRYDHATPAQASVAQPVPASP